MKEVGRSKPEETPDDQKTRILHITPFVGRTSFGIGPIVLSMAASQQALGHSVSIWCFDTQVEVQQLEVDHSLHPQTICSFPILGPRPLGYSLAMLHGIVSRGLAYDIVHQHGIWTAVSHVLIQWRRRTGSPTVIAPQGSLEPWALKRSRWKKRLALLLYERQNLHDVSCMQALSIREAADFRAFGIIAPAAVIPNGISNAWMSQRHDSARFRLRHSIPDNARIMLFLARITPKKGLPLLLHVLDRCREKLADWKLVIAGVDEFNHEQEVRSLVHELALQPYVQFVGPQFGQDKRDAFGAADLFVLPSHSEGAPVTILEALGAGVPVLTTKSSPWEDLLTHDCGWWTDISVEGIAGALQDALRRPQCRLGEMGLRGKQLVSEKYTWPQIAGQTLALYDWLLSRGTKPTFIVGE